MKIFDKNDEWGGEKVNFLDDNGVFVGYSLAQDCCEHADWFIANKPQKKLLESSRKPRLKGWNFDPSFFQELGQDDMEDKYALDQGGMIIFRMVKGTESKYLHIFNSHNGYYGHGFEFKIGEEVKHEGSL